MSLDRSLKSRNALERHRNVLSRDERLAILVDEGRWDESQSVYALPKVSHRKSSAGKKVKKAKDEAADAKTEASAATDAAKSD